MRFQEQKSALREKLTLRVFFQRLRGFERYGSLTKILSSTRSTRDMQMRFKCGCKCISDAETWHPCVTDGWTKQLIKIRTSGFFETRFFGTPFRMGRNVLQGVADSERSHSRRTESSRRMPACNSEPNSLRSQSAGNPTPFESEFIR